MMALFRTFEEYRAWADPTIKNCLKMQYDKFSTVLEPLRRMGLVQSYLNDTRQTPPPPEPRALYVLGAAATQLAIGIHASLSNGVVFPAAGNFRTLFEVLLSVKLIRQNNTKDRSDLYMDFIRVLQWNHIQKSIAAGLKIDRAINADDAKRRFGELKNKYSSNPTYWWSSIVWSTPKEAAERVPIGPKRVCKFLDKENVDTGIPGYNTFTELEVRWHATFSTLTHATALATHAMVADGQPSMAWKIDPNTTRLAVLALAACTHIIALCEDGLQHPQAKWARRYLEDLRDSAVLAQDAFEPK